MKWRVLISHTRWGVIAYLKPWAPSLEDLPISADPHMRWGVCAHLKPWAPSVEALPISREYAEEAADEL